MKRAYSVTYHLSIMSSTDKEDKAKTMCCCKVGKGEKKHIRILHI